MFEGSNMTGSSFELINKDTKSKLHQPTVLIFPGIHENNVEVKYLGEEVNKRGEVINKKNGSCRLIFTYNGTINKDTNATSLEEKTKPIINELLNEQPPYKPYPIWLIGYSYGCTMAYEVAVRLKNYGFDPHLILIDGVAPRLAHQYFLSNHPSVSTDIVQLFNSAASAFKLNGISLAGEELEKLNALPLPMKIDFPMGPILAKNKNDSKDRLDKFIQSGNRVKQNLNTLFNPSCLNLPDASSKLNKINVLMTKETQIKYANALKIPIDSLVWGGWDEYANSLEGWEQYKTYPDLQETIQHLINEPHTSLMKGQNCENLAALLTISINTEVSNDQVFVLEVWSKFTEEVTKGLKKTHKNSSVSDSNQTSPNLESPDENNDAMEIENIYKRSSSSSQTSSPASENSPAVNQHRFFTPPIPSYSSRSIDDQRRGLLRSPPKSIGSPTF